MSLLFVVVGLVGITNILTRSYLFENVRESIKIPWLQYLSQCPACTGTWVGFLYYMIAVCEYVSVVESLVELFVWGGAISICSAVVVACLDYIYFLKSSFISSSTEVAANTTNSENNEE